MATEVIDQTKLEAVCKSCYKSFAFDRINLNHLVVCKNCGFSSFLTPDRILKKLPVFSQKTTPVKEEEKKEQLKHLFRYFRHGADTSQIGIILELTTTNVKFTTMVSLPIGSKIGFNLKDKKFIVKIVTSSIIRPESRNGTTTIQYEVTAEYETVLTGEPTVPVYNPHYLIK